MEPELDAGDMEMTSKEAAAYLSGPVGFEVSAKFSATSATSAGVLSLTNEAPALVYRKSTLDAFLNENGTDPTAWHAGMWREVVGQLRAISESAGDDGLNPLIETLEKRDLRDDWDPDDA